MILVQPDPQQITKSIPRESGDDPTSEGSENRLSWYSPRERG